MWWVSGFPWCSGGLVVADGLDVELVQSWPVGVDDADVEVVGEQDDVG
jgi:hypothetical protein